MPFIQGTKNMEFSCSLQHLLKATHKRRSKGVRMSRILNKNTCTKGELFMTFDVENRLQDDAMHPRLNRHASQPKHVSVLAKRVGLEPSTLRSESHIKIK